MRKSVFTLFLVLGVFGVFAQSGKHSAHSRMHEQQLAKNVSPIEKNMILESFKEEVLQREESQSPVSEESDRMFLGP